MATVVLVNLFMVLTGDFCLVIPWPGHGVTKDAYGFKIYKHRLSKKTSSFPRRRESIVFICPCGAMDTRRRGYDVCDVFLKLKNHKLYRHSHVGGNLLFLFVPAGQWIPAVAGMTGGEVGQYKMTILSTN